jgi:hypothetical protein
MIPALLNHRGGGNKAELAVHFVWTRQACPGIAKLRVCIKLAEFGCGATVTRPLSVPADDRFSERAAIARASR